MRFCWTTIYVKSLEESIEFYSNVLGLEIVNQFAAGTNMKIAMLGENGGTLVELIEEEGTVYQPSTGLSIGFQVDDLEKALEMIKNSGIPVTRGPISPTPTTSFFFIDDPNGVEIQIVQVS